MRLINTEYLALDRSPAALRRFGLTTGGAFLSLGGWFAWRHRGAAGPMLAAGVLLLLAAILFPPMLKALHRVWMTFALAIGFVMTRVILTIVFFLVLTPIGLLQRLFGKCALDLGFRTVASTYWEPRTTRRPTASDYEKQF